MRREPGIVSPPPETCNRLGRNAVLEGTGATCRETSPRTRRPIREHLGLHSGDRLDCVVQDDGRVLIRPATQDVGRLKGLLRREEKLLIQPLVLCGLVWVLESAYGVSDRWRTGIAVAHISNAGLHRENPGQQDIFVTCAYGFCRIPRRRTSSDRQ